MTSIDSLLLLVLALQALLLIGVALTFRSLRKKVHLADLAAQERADALFCQVEGLMAIYAVAGERAMLPRSRGWAASPDFLQVLIGVFRDRAPSVILECGSGLSTLVAASLCRTRGKGTVYSLDHDPVYAERTRKLIRTHGLEQWANVVDAPLTSTAAGEWHGAWYDTSGLPPDLSVDLLVVDGPPSSVAHLARYPAVPALQSRLAGGARILLDDAARSDEQQILALWLKEFPWLSQENVDRCEKGCALLASSKASGRDSTPSFDL